MKKSADTGSKDGKGKPYEGETISILWVSNSTMDGDNVVKTRLASCDMADFISYN